MSWYCSNCGTEHAKPFDEPTMCAACKIADGYEYVLDALARQLDAAGVAPLEGPSLRLGDRIRLLADEKARLRATLLRIARGDDQPQTIAMAALGIDHYGRPVSKHFNYESMLKAAFPTHVGPKGPVYRDEGEEE